MVLAECLSFDHDAQRMISQMLLKISYFHPIKIFTIDYNNKNTFRSKSLQIRKSDPPEYSGFTRRNHELRRLISKKNPQDLAYNTGGVSHPDQNNLEILFWDRSVVISLSSLEIFDKISQQVLPEFSQAMILYYLHLADGTPVSGRWVSFAELPDGRFYQHAFQGYTGQLLAHDIGNHIEGFEKVARALNAQKEQLGHASYIFQALPKVPMLVIQWLGDEDFPANFQILFDDTVHHFLPSDGCAILGSMLTKKIISKYQTDFGYLFTGTK